MGRANLSLHATSILPLSMQLAAMADDGLTAAEQELLRQVINQLYLDLAAGHSCSLSSEVAVGQTSSQVVQLLLKSGLAASYRALPRQVLALPISILELDQEPLVYLSKYFAYELMLSQQVKDLSQTSLTADADEALAQLQQLATQYALPNLEQLAAIKHCCQHKFSIISGGPGTGKTTTVTLLLWLLYQIYGSDLRVKICAPTGKAAIRVREALVSSSKRLKDMAIDCHAIDELLADNGNFLTIHKLLGYRPQRIYFQYNRQRTLPLEVLIVDESSMIGLPLFAKLLQALPGESIKHVILLGDKNQLSSVEEGYVFAALVKMQVFDDIQYDLFANSQRFIASHLSISNRNQQEVGELAHAVLTNDEAYLARFCTNVGTKIKLYPPRLTELMPHLWPAESQDFFAHIAEQIENNRQVLAELFTRFNQHSVLCLTNSGELGSDNLNRRIEQQIRNHYGLDQEWYNGRPIIILNNDYNLELFNGDIGICLIVAGSIKIIFADGRQLIPEILPRYKLAYAITIHKAQGSEYEHVNVVLSESGRASESLLSRELVYTAITRARTSVTIFASAAVLLQAIAKPVKRSSGLPLLLAN